MILIKFKNEKKLGAFKHHFSFLKPRLEFLSLLNRKLIKEFFNFIFKNFKNYGSGFR